MNNDTDRASYSPDEIAFRNDLGRSTIWAEMKSGRLRYLKVGRLRRITADMEAEWLERLTAETAEPVPLAAAG